MISSVPASGNGSVYNDRSFSPYGQEYQNSGYNDPLLFGSINADLFATSGTGALLYDTPNRELAINASRWLSPDPAGVGWNQYAYVTDPLSTIDPSGLGPGGICGLGSQIGSCSGFPGTDPMAGNGCQASLDGGAVPCNLLGGLGGLSGFGESTAVCPLGVATCIYVNGPNGGMVKWGNCAYDDGGFHCDNEAAVDSSGCNNYVTLNCGPGANNGPLQRLLNIAQQIQNCPQFSNVGNQIAQGVNSGSISVGNVPSNGVATTNGYFSPKSVIDPDALDDPSTVIHEWIHQTQAVGNPFFILLKGANQIQALVNSKVFGGAPEGFLDTSAQAVANKIVSVCGVK